MMHQLKHGLAGMLLALVPGMAIADCDDLRTQDLDAAAPNIDVPLLQTGLRTATKDSNTLLRDGTLGVYTKSKLVVFCRDFALPTDVNSVLGTIKMAEEYGTLEGLSRDWYGKTSDDSFAARLLPLDDSEFSLDTLALAGPPALTASVLTPSDTRPAVSCAGITDSTLPAEAQTGALALTAIDPDTWPDATAICEALAAPGGKDGTIAALTSFGKLEAALPGSVYQVISPDFAVWMGESIATRGPRLVGSDDAVIALLGEYRDEDRPAAPRDYSTLYLDLPASCIQTAGAGAITNFTAFDQAALDSFQEPVDVSTLLAEVLEQKFDTASRLRAAINQALEGKVSQCALDQVNLAVTSADDFGLLFSLNDEKAANLALVESFADSAPIVAPLVGLSAPSRGALLAGARAAIQEATEERVAAEIEVAAATLSAASEPVPETFDTLPPGLEEFEPIPLNPTIGVTEATDSAVIATVEDPDFRQVLLDTGYPPAPNEEVLKGNVRSILAPVAASRVAASVNRDMTQLLAVVESSWSLTDELQAAIAAAPAIRAGSGIAGDPEALAALEQLLGIQYPNERLFGSAVKTLNIDATFAPEVEASALRDAGDLTIERQTNIALPDCGCVRPRVENTEVYGFYPFWFAPVVVDEDAAAQDTDDAEAAEPPEDDPTTQLIDFGLVSRAAFYGLEFTIVNPGAEPDSGRVGLLNEGPWAEGRRDFVNAAHQHRAKADLAIKLTGWDQWNDNEIATVVRQIDILMEPYEKLDSYEWEEIKRAFPTIRDDPQPDGVTLIIDGYDGKARIAPNVGNLISLVSTLQERLAQRGQTINLAFDLDLVGDAETDQLFSDIRPLLIGQSPMVDLVLVFLERRTTDTKKTLRARVERGAFQGDDRARLFRRIVPVVPPGGHENVFQTKLSNTGTSTPNEPFSQFADDLVYFRANFGGIGFWPSPDPNGTETPDISALLADQWFDPTLPAILSSFEERFDATCTIVCPYRTYVAAVAALLFVATVIVVWRAFYSGLANRIAYKFGVAWITGGGLFALLMALTACDHVAFWPPIFVFLILVGLGLMIWLRFYQTAQSGPKP